MLSYVQREQQWRQTLSTVKFSFNVENHPNIVISLFNSSLFNAQKS